MMHIYSCNIGNANKHVYKLEIILLSYWTVRNNVAESAVLEKLD
jgi:hypothetical protein